MAISVAIIEDDIHYNGVLKKVIDHEADMFCVAQFYCGREASKGMKELKDLDVAIVDINLRDISGIDIMNAAKKENPKTQFVMCTCYEDDENILSALGSGASGYLLKGEGIDKIVSSIREVYYGGVPLTSSVARKVIQKFSPTRYEIPSKILTYTETEIMRLLMGGLSYREIGERQCISLDTVRKHLMNAYRKLNVNNKIEAINKFKDLV